MANVTLDQAKHTIESLEKHYRGFIAPTFRITVKNKDIVKTGMSVESVTVDLSTGVEGADMAKFSITNAYDIIKRDFMWTDSILQLGNSIIVHTGYTDQIVPIFFGYITNIDFDFSSGGASINVTAMDISFLMRRSGESETWNNMKISDVVKEIGRKYAITSFDIDATTEVEEEIKKNTESDYDFIAKQAEERDLDFFIVGKKLYFRKKNTAKTPVMKLEWGKNLISCSIDHSLDKQRSKVTVKGVINDTKEVVTVESTTVNKLGKNSTTGQNIMKKLGHFVEVIQTNVDDRAHAQRIANSRMEKIARKLVTVNGSSIGLPELRAGRNIDIGGLGAKLDTTYTIDKVTHTVNSSGYITNFTLEGNAV